MSKVNSDTIALCKQTKQTIRNTKGIIETIAINRQFDTTKKCQRTGEWCEWKNVKNCKECDIK